MDNYIPATMSLFFADDLAIVFSDQMNFQFTRQCTDLNCRLSQFIKASRILFPLNGSTN